MNLREPLLAQLVLALLVVLVIVLLEDVIVVILNMQHLLGVLIAIIVANLVDQHLIMIA